MDKVIDILMLGPKRAGKSSVLASMIESFDRISKDHKINIKADTDTEVLLFNKRCEMDELFSKYKGEGCYTDMGSQTPGSMHYRFSVTYENGGHLPDIRITDIPGEWVTDLNHGNEVATLVNESSIIIFAIDTVHMMEEDGRFFEIFHKTRAMQNLVSSDEFLQNGSKLVLFVPLKCEKYYHAGKMDEVTQRVEMKKNGRNIIGFGNIIDTLRNNQNITMAITPILTMGELEFNRFRQDEQGNVLTITSNASDPTYRRPEAAIYEFTNGSSSMRRPQYCEQPVLYILSWLFKLYKASAENMPKKPSHRGLKRLLRIAGAIVAAIVVGNPFVGIGVYAAMNLFSSTEWEETYNNTIQPNLKRDGDGYKIIQNPLAF